MENSESICINNNMIKPGGAIGRLTYFWQGLILGFTSGLLAMIIVAFSNLIKGADNSFFALLLALLAIVLIVLTLYVSVLLMHKRCVDILGKTKNSVVMVIGIILIGLIPYVSLIAGLFLLFMPGKITSPKTLEVS
jgi:uncharacterized membrane protein YhaH (DUF805 family)